MVELWAKESGIPSEHMTINIVTSTEQHGNKYKVMANLSLPSVWSDREVSLLQFGLAKALSHYYSLTLNDVHVVTTVIMSGRVVESGAEASW
ncbi:hypothetical protein GCM10009114_30320 [Aliiglaciecola litoralis]|uniref:Uncharacterized protein n=1 Tax=Aliiglaciecola litoralis TaxID=582857 RepID=A0ABN1LQ36_9ALTE